MASWATKRKLTYLSIIGGALFILVVIPLFLLLYEKPTCFDGKWNGDELGTDCSGSCVILCSFETLEPTILWSRVFRVTDNVYSVIAYVENSNIGSEARNVPYVFKLYDDQNIAITEREGIVSIPRNKRFAIFEGKIAIGDRKPHTVKFEFTAPIVWVKSSAVEPLIEVRGTALMRQETSPRVEADLVNKTLDTISNIEVTAIVYDAYNNAVGASQTYVDRLLKGETGRAVFTWPSPFVANLEVCGISTDTMLVIDRSGSMDDDGGNPPEPLTDAKNAALSFIESLGANDRVGMISFATEPSKPIDSPLTAKYTDVKAKVSALAIIGVPAEQNTNLGDGLLGALTELESSHTTNNAKQVIIGLTDGVATHPTKEGEEDYPLTYAAEIAEKIKTKDIELFMIGLGNTVNTAYLQSISTDVNHYYAAATGKDLKNIYLEIATKICEKRPAVIEIISRVLPSKDQVIY